MGQVFPFVLVFQLCLSVLGLLGFFGVVYYPTIHRVSETVLFSLGFSLLVPLLALMVAWVVCVHALGEGRCLKATLFTLSYLGAVMRMVDLVGGCLMCLLLAFWEDLFQEVFCCDGGEAFCV